MFKGKDSRSLGYKVIIHMLWFMLATSIILHAVEEEREIILELYPRWYSPEDYVIQGNVGLQKAFQINEWVKIYANPSIAYSINDRWSFHGGLGLYHTAYKTEDNNFEIRPFLGINHSTPLGEKWSLSSYLRAEDRIQYNTNTRDKTDTLRLRIRFQTAYMINPILKDNLWHKIILGVEGFKSYIDDDKDSGIQDYYDYESRITAGIERSLADNDKVRFEVTWKYQKPPKDISENSVSTIYFKLRYFPTWEKILNNRLFDRDLDE